MSGPLNNDDLVQGAGGSDRRDRGRREYRPPTIECFGKLDRIARFGGSNAVDSGSGLGNQPFPAPNR